MNIHEYQAKELLAQVRRAGARGPCRDERRRSGRSGGKLPGPLYVVKAQIHAGGRGKGKFKELGPDAKGGVRLAEDARRGARGRDRHARQHAGHDPDRRRRQAGQPPLRHRRRRHRQGILPRDAGRSRHRPDRDGRLDRGRHGHRDGRARHAREDPHASTIDPADRLHAASWPRRCRGARADRRSRQAGGEASRRQLYDAFLGTDMSQIEINPLAETDDGKLLVLDAKVSFDSNALYPPQGSGRAARRDRGGPDGDRGVASTTSPTSSSTAISAAWSTAPASRWRRWTSSS